MASIRVISLFPDPKPSEFLVWNFDKYNFIVMLELGTDSLDSEAESSYN
jgi:hypothetical protein